MGKILTIFRKLSAPWVFNSFNVIILLFILFLLLLQPHLKKGAPITAAISINENAPLSAMDSGNTVDESPPIINKQAEQELLKASQEQSNVTAVTAETKYADINNANKLFDSKEYEQALIEYMKVADQSNPSTEADLVQYRIGECYQKLGRLDEALSAYQNVVTEHFQSHFRIRAMLREGECLVDKGDFLKARKLLFALMAQEAIYSDEDKGFVTEAYYKIAESYMKEALRYARIQGYAYANEKQ